MKLQLQWLAGHDAQTVSLPSPKKRIAASIAVAIVALIAGLAIGGGAWLWQRAHPERRLARFSIVMPPAAHLTMWAQAGVAVSPDGQTIVWPGGSGSSTQLFSRTVDRDETVPVDGTAMASRPFFSPDGQWIGFFSGNLLKMVGRGGGATQTIAKGEGAPLGGVWLRDAIVYTTAAGVYRVRPGGTPEVIFSKPPSRAYRLADSGVRSPAAIGDQTDSILCEMGPDAAPKIAMFSLKDRRLREITDGAAPIYLARIRALLFIRNGSLFGAHFDSRKGALTSPPVPLVDGVTVVPPYNVADLGVSTAGTMAFARGNLSAPPRMVTVVDRKGAAVPLIPLVRGFEDPRVSPDGKHIAVTIRSTTDTDIWIIDVERGILTRSTFDKGEDETPIWTADGKRITWGAERGAASSTGGAGLGGVRFIAPRPAGVERSISWQGFDSSTPEEKLVSTNHGHPGSWSPDGKTLVYTDYRADFVGEIWTWSAVDHQKKLFLANGYSTRGPMFSRDGHWIAYTSNESGRDEVYVRPFPGPGGVVQVSSDGGSEPVWSHRGDEIFFRNGDKLLSARVHPGPQFSTDPPRVLFSGDFLAMRRGESAYDVMPDDEHFVMIKQDQDPNLLRLNVVLNWFGEVEAKLKAAEQ